MQSLLSRSWPPERCGTVGKSPQSAAEPRPPGPPTPLRCDRNSCLGSLKEGSGSPAGLVCFSSASYSWRQQKKKQTFTFSLFFLPFPSSPLQGIHFFAQLPRRWRYVSSAFESCSTAAFLRGLCFCHPPPLPHLHRIHLPSLQQQNKSGRSPLILSRCGETFASPVAQRFVIARLPARVPHFPHTAVHVHGTYDSPKNKQSRNALQKPSHLRWLPLLSRLSFSLARPPPPPPCRLPVPDPRLFLSHILHMCL